jgi:uncharacterized protein with FMN-binding domain
MPNRPFTIAILAGSALTPLTAAAAAPTALAATTTTTATYRGPSVAMRWGNVAVTIKVARHKVVSLSATYPIERPRSMFINSVAIPRLRSEALSAQRASINAISGATLTSQAFISSLSAALKSAHV